MRFFGPSAAAILSMWLCHLLMQSEAVLNGDKVFWNGYGFMTKVLARGENRRAQSCTGSLISPSLVLTAAECMINRTTRAKLTEFQVLVAKIKGSKKQYDARLVDMNENWALLQIQPLNTTELCPAEPIPPRMVKLNMKPSLLAAAQYSIDEAYITDNDKCYLVGFEHSSDPAAFIPNQNVQRISLEKLKKPEPDTGTFYRSRIVQNRTACFDDTGAALICHVGIQGHVQVGLFQSLSIAEDNKLNKSSAAVCSKAAQMEFSLLTSDERLSAAIQKAAFLEFIDAYTKCGYIS
uniref:Peptidase S1 domain-containing protein n=1 Tax=Ditylenchus dipsaci TaxID=166011 RepID=A0A915DZC1_9BILA